MRLLLDTSVVLRTVAAPGRLAAQLRELLTDGAAQAWFSVVVPWKIAIKAALGKLQTSPEMVVAELLDQDVAELPVRSAHAFETRLLPRVHKNAFDRIQIARARVERMTLVTTDRGLGRYDVDIMLT